MNKENKFLKMAFLITCIAILMSSCAKKPTETKDTGAVAKPAVAQESSPDAKPNENTAAKGAETKPASGKGGWMKEVPDVIPQFTYGTFDKDSSYAMGNDISLYFEDITKENMDDYAEKLKSKGFKVEIEEQTDGLHVYSVNGLISTNPGKVNVSAELQVEDKHVDMHILIHKE